MKILLKYSFMLTLLTLRGSWEVWRPPTSLIIWSHWGLVSTVVGRVIFRSFLSCESQRSRLAWVRRVRHGGLKILTSQASRAISSHFFILPRMARHQFPEPTPSWYIFSTGTSCCSSLSRTVWVGAFRENPLQVLGLWWVVHWDH